ncbi:E3 ubiquitin-protein ligase rnf13 [Mactra antiquata]
MATMFEPVSVLLYLFLWNIIVEANVLVMKTENSSVTVDSFLDREALFGPSIPDDGVKGFIYNVNPFNACKPVDPPPDNISVWIALIARDNCTFVDKVRNVQPWFAAAIVYNRKDDNDVTQMQGDGEGINIPSVFVGYDDGILLSKNYCYNCTPFDLSSKGSFEVLIEETVYYHLSPIFFILFAVVVGLCLITMISFLVFKWCRDFRRKRRSRLSIKHLKKIPQKKFKKGDEYDVCAICLDDYEEGDKLRLLPCSHVYHTKCIDPWLTKNKRSCPICKRKVIPGDDPDSDSENSDSDDDTPSERTPLLTAGASGGTSSNRRSTFDNSGLPTPDPQARVNNVNENVRHASSDDSDQSDSEYGAAGGMRHVNLGKENPLLSLGRSPVNAEISTNQNSRNEHSSNHSIEDTVVIETQNSGKDNVGFDEVEDAETTDDDDGFDLPVDEVVFSEPLKKDDKKSNGVI